MPTEPAIDRIMTSDTERPRVLVVDDESTITHVLHQLLGEYGCTVHTAGSAEKALEMVLMSPPDVALVDIILPRMNGLELLARIKKISPDTEVLIMTSNVSVETAVQAIRAGAYDYLQKPFEDLENTWHRVQRALEKRHLQLRNRLLLQEHELNNREQAATVMRLTSLIDAGRAMGEFDSLPELLDFFIGLVTQELDVERASLMLIKGDEMHIAASRGITTVEAEKVRVRLGEGVAGMVAETGEAYLVTDTKTDPRIETELHSTLSHSFISAPIILSIPIKSRETVLGVINATNRRSKEEFSAADLDYLTGLAGQLAVAIDRTTHFENLQTAYESLEAAQDQLVRSERLKALGEMAAGVAHDFNNSLSVILGRAEFALRREQQGESNTDLVAELEAIRTVARQSVDTIRRIQDYTRIRKDSPDTTLQLNDVIRDVVEMTRPKWKQEREAHGVAIDVTTDLQEIPPICGNAVELNQVVNNLLFNAVEAMPEGGALTFRTRMKDGQVILEVQDTGIGMTPETIKHLFEPFFTTKENGQGLGMSIVYGILQRHKAQIETSSGEGRGTTFRLTFPAHATEGPLVQDTIPQKQEPDTTARILLVDDDAGVREFYEDALLFGGHQVVSVDRGRAALALLAKRPFDLVITDLSMQEMSGLEVARGVKKMVPGLPVVLLSGWAIQQDNDEIRQAGVDFVLSKPCSIDHLFETVQLALRNGGGIK